MRYEFNIWVFLIDKFRHLNYKNRARVMVKPNNPLNFGIRDTELQDYCSLVNTPKVNIFTLFDGSTYATTYYMVEIYNER